jgi:hypothetical protein
MNTVKVNRNSVDVSFVPTPYKRGKKAEAGDLYLAVDAAISFEDLVKYWGQEEAHKELLSRTNLRAQGWFETASTAVDAEGNEVDKPFDEAEFSKYATEFSARGMSRDDMEALRVTITDELLSLATNTNLDAGTKQEKALALLTRMQGIDRALAARKRKKEEAVAA